MNSVILLGMFCAIVVTAGALIGLVILLMKPARSKADSASGAPIKINKPMSKGWASWILYIFVALLFALWSFWISLLFLVTVWIMQLNPGKDSTDEVRVNDKKTASRVYTWLFFSSFITVPVFISTLVFNYSSSTNELVFIALLPLIFHAPLLLGLTSKSAFVFRHTQQGILLIALRAAMASIVAVDDDLWLLFILGNGSLWLFGSIWGWNQISRGECWLMKRKGESLQVSTAQIASHPAHVHLEKSRAFIGQYKKNEAYNHALAAFRNGDREIRLQAIQLLKTLDEVETF